MSRTADDNPVCPSGTQRLLLQALQEADTLTTLTCHDTHCLQCFHRNGIKPCTRQRCCQLPALCAAPHLRQLQSSRHISMLRSSASDRHFPRCTDHFSADNAAYWYGKHPQRTPAADTCCAGISRAYYGRIERGEHSLTVEKCQMIATALGVRIADLFTELPE